ncbi:5'-Nucleotidase domain protein [Leptothrix cholodnii SP-6]|uniref:5'-Nucleotidase domain protein n=1 Tax=Leptothrix cholodnii (strain ATCC 51168 / LMG 8142 / SP-6) TaxID=395495 RepID=B1Y1L0_LEPCP|nr:5'-Nucleotidase domain protein [Leptothrix cholodnii SP-6]
MRVKTIQVAVVLALSSLLLTACGGSGDDAAALPATAYEMQLLHVSDMDSGGDLVTNSKGLSALVQKFRSEMPDHTVFLSSGDNYIPGPFFNAADDASLSAELGAPSAGRADIAILNAMGLQASAFGNHEFDLGTRTVSDLIRTTGTWVGAQFPYLSANLNFSADGNLAAVAAAANDGVTAGALRGKIAKYTVVSVGGQTIGVVGATTPTLPSITTVGGITVAPTGASAADIDALVAQIQPSVDALVARGIDKIVLLAHMQQLTIEEQLAPKLRDVDVIVAGGSNTGLYDSTDYVRPGDTNRGTYPKTFTSAKSEPVLLVNVDADYKYLGRLVLPFDAQGRVITGKLDAARNGAWASDTEGLRRAGLSAADAMPAVAAIADKIQAVISSKDGNLFGAASVYLEGDRVLVRNQETNLGNLTAEANLALARATDASTTLSFKNGGGVRSSIGTINAPPGSTSGGFKDKTAANTSAGKQAGDISQLDIEFSLRFNNGLSLLTIDAQQLKDVLEHGVADWTATSTSGRFPQVAGLRFSFDPTGAALSRIRTIVVDDPDGAGPLTEQVVYSGGAFKVPVTRTWRIVTLDFLAGGGDSYPFPAFVTANAAQVNRIDLVPTGVTKTFTTAGTEQKALADHLAAAFPRTAPYGNADGGAATDQRIVNLSVRTEILPQ